MAKPKPIKVKIYDLEEFDKELLEEVVEVLKGREKLYSVEEVKRLLKEGKLEEELKD